MTLKKIVSFGFKHKEPPARPGDVVVDVRTMFHNPYRVRSLRDKPGTDPDVQAIIVQTPNFGAKYQYLKARVTVPGTEVAYIGCTGGKHRSVFLAEKLGEDLGIPVEHRDLDRP